MIKIPPNNQWTQTNRGDVLGSLWASYNLDLTKKPAKTRVSPRMLLNVNSTTLANLGLPCAARYFDSSGEYIWVAAGARMFYSTGGLDTALVQDATGSTPTALNSAQTDIEIFNGAMYVSGASTSLFKLAAAGTWSTLTSKVNNSSGLHAMAFFRSTNRLYFVDDNAVSVGSIDTSDAAASLGAQYTLQNLVDATQTRISWIRATSSRIYIGTISYNGDKARVYSWDGSQFSGPNDSYLLEDNGSYAAIVKDDVLHIFTTNGRLLAFNGGTFVEVARLPYQDSIFGSYFATPATYPVHYNGMTLVEGKINILINTKKWEVGEANPENVPSGIWEYDRDIGLYHKASLGRSTAAGTITDYGQQRLSAVGALVEMKSPSNNFTVGVPNGTFLAGATYFTDATSTLQGVFYDDFKDTLQKYGYLVTQKIYSQNIEDTWQSVYSRHKKFLESSDSITIKYRTSEDDPAHATITWVDTNTFTVPQASLDLTTEGFLVGHEVEILQGDGSGKCAHMSAINLNAGTYTVDLDDTFTGVTTNTAKARFQKWIKAGVCTDQTVKHFKFPVGVADTWVQLKACMQFTGKNEVDDLILINNVHMKAD